jgi:tetraacyldisaccharide-1-P 4'-kinase
MQKIALADHHDFSEPNAKNGNPEVWDAVNTKQLFMTEKDAVKLFPLIRNLKSSQPADLQLGNADTPNAWAIPLTLSLEQAFLATLYQKLSLIHGHQTA